MPPDQKPDSADYYYPGAASPTFMMVGAACRSQSFEEIIQMDLDRLTSQGEGRDATASQMESLREGTVLVYRYDDEGNH